MRFLPIYTNDIQITSSCALLLDFLFKTTKNLCQNVNNNKIFIAQKKILHIVTVIYKNKNINKDTKIIDYGAAAKLFLTQWYQYHFQAH